MPMSFTVNQMPDWYKQHAEAAMLRAQQLANEPYKRYREDRVFPLSKEQLRAAALSGREGVYEPYFNSANALLGNIARETFPGMHRNYMNPYENHVIRNMEKDSLRTFRRKILPALENKFVRLGQHGSSGHRKLALRAARDIQNEIADKRFRALAHGYDQSAQQFSADQARRLMAAKELANLGQMRHAGHVADIASLEQMGNMLQRQGQMKSNVDYDTYLKEMAVPSERLSQWVSTIHGMPHGSASHIYENPVTAPPQLNTIGNMGNIMNSMFALRQGMR